MDFDITDWLEPDIGVDLLDLSDELESQLVPAAFRISTRDIKLDEPLRSEVLDASATGDLELLRALPNVRKELEAWFTLEPHTMRHEFGLVGRVSTNFHRMLSCLLLPDEGTKYPTKSNHKEESRMIRSCAKRQLETLRGCHLEDESKYDKHMDPSQMENQYNYIASVTESFLMKLSSHDVRKPPLGRREMEAGCGFELEQIGELIRCRLTSDIYICNRGLAFWIEWRRGKLGRQTIHIYGGLLRAIVDVTRARSLVLRACRTALETGCPGYPAEQCVLACWNWGDKILGTLGNHAYKAIKLFEALCIGRLSEMSNELIMDKRKFLNTMLDEVEEAASRAARDEIRSVLSGMTKSSEVSQVFGLFRTWSHPLTNTAGGIEKMKEASFKYQALDRDQCQEVTAKIIEMYCTNHRMKESRYPPGRFKNKMADGRSWKKSEVVRAFRNQRKVEKSSKLYRLKDWCEIILDRRPQRGMTLNELSLISDKAASLTLEKLATLLDEKGMIPQDDDKRVLLAYIKQDLPPLHEILDKINREGLKKDQLLIGVVPKERELKGEDPRMFSLMPYLFRYYITATEALISQYILGYFPEITMTNSGAQVKNKMIRSTAETRSGDQRDNTVIVINLDFSKWNSHQRSDFVTPGFAFFDRALGYDNLIARTHEFFSASVHYRADNIVCPTGDELRTGTGASCWIGQHGGNEGLRQKGWTICTVAAIMYVMEKEGIQCKLYAQGDNQVLLIEVPRRYKEGDDAARLHRREAKTKAETALARLAEFFGRLGLPLKTEETWCSSTIFAYSKILFAEGMEQPQSVKKVTRASYMTNDEHQTTSAQISTCFATCVSMMEFDKTPVVAYEISLHEVVEALRWGKIYAPASPYGFLNHPIANTRKTHFDLYDGKRRRRIKWSDVESKELLEDRSLPYLAELISLFPAVLGGLASTNMCLTLTRGFPDHVSSSAGAIRKFIEIHQKAYPSICDRLEYLLSLPLKMTIDPAQLIEDPQALNISRSRQAKHILKDAAMGFLRNSDYVKNRLVKVMIAIQGEQYDIKNEILWAMTPFLPRVASLIMAADPSGAAVSWVGMLDSTATIQSVAKRENMKWLTGPEDARNIEQRIAIADSDAIMYVLWRLSKPGKSHRQFRWVSLADPKQLLVKLVNEARWISWQREDIDGVTINHPISFTKLYPVEKGLCKECGGKDMDARPPHVHIAVNLPKDRNPTDIFELRGPCMPYVGGKTQQKTTFTSDHIYEQEDVAFKALKRIASLIGWIVPSGSLLEQELKKRIRSMTDLKFEEIVSNLVECSSSVLHRLDDPRTSHGGYPGLSTGPSTWLSLSTNTMKEFAKGTDNRALHFQQLLIYAQSLVLLDLWHRVYHDESIPPSYHLHITKNNEIPTVNEGHPDLPSTFEVLSKVNGVVYKEYPEIPMLYCKRSIVNPLPKASLGDVQIMITIEGLTEALKALIKKKIVAQKAMRHAVIGQQMAADVKEKEGALEYIWMEFSDPDDVISHVAWLAILVLVLDTDGAHLTELFGEPADRAEALVKFGFLHSHHLHNNFFMPLAALVSNQTARKKITLLDHINLQTTMSLSKGEAIAWARSAVEDVWQKWSDDKRIGLDGSVPLFAVDLIDEATSSLEMQLSLLSRCLLSLDVRTVSDYKKMKSVLREAATGKYASRVLLGTISIPEVFRKNLSPKDSAVARQALPPYRLMTSEDQAERELRGYGQGLPPIDKEEPRVDTSAWERATNVLPNSPRTELIQDSWSVSPHLTARELERTCPCAHIYRGISVITTAHMKIREVLATIPPWDSPINAGCFADGVGGFGRAMMQAFQIKDLWHNTLIVNGDSIPSSHTETMSPLLERYRTKGTTIRGKNLLVDGITDITTEEFWDALLTCLGDSRLDLITVDAEWKNTDGQFPIRLSAHLSQITQVMNEGAVLIVKGYLASEGVFKVLASSLWDCFEEVRVLGSSFSAHKSTEVYVVARNPLAGSHPAVTMAEDGHYRGMLPHSWVSLLPRKVQNMRLHPLSSRDVIVKDDRIRSGLTSSERESIRRDWSKTLLRFGLPSKPQPTSFRDLLRHIAQSPLSIWSSTSEGQSSNQTCARINKQEANEIFVLVYLASCMLSEGNPVPMKSFHYPVHYPRLVILEMSGRLELGVYEGPVIGPMLSKWQELNPLGRRVDVGITVFGMPDLFRKMSEMRVWLRRLAGLRLLFDSIEVPKERDIPKLSDLKVHSDFSVKRDGIRLSTLLTGSTLLDSLSRSSSK